MFVIQHICGGQRTISDITLDLLSLLRWGEGEVPKLSQKCYVAQAPLNLKQSSTSAFQRAGNYRWPTTDIYMVWGRVSKHQSLYLLGCPSGLVFVFFWTQSLTLA